LPDASRDDTTASDERPADDDEGSGDGCDLREVWGDEVSLDADEVESLRAAVMQNCGFDILRPPPWARDHWDDDQDQRYDDSDDDDRGERDRDSRERDDDDRSTERDESDSSGSERIEEPTDRGDDEQEESPDHNDPTENGEPNGSPEDERRESRD
jgi:hypothetical protein